ncbi:MAG: hypothetical protein ACR2LL_01855 [Nitrosopumilus sp.]|uniref:hypothetical protein n=1 Tax=Nitrosopumilus sp. TaxID=2024843 RepID=UPI002930140C|nr:hypothetical protein [Nitrosopumilus sp.]
MIPNSIIASGVVIVILGLIFHLQGQSVVGPESSFMYSNPDWITYGIQIIIVGLVIIAFGIIIRVLRRINS